MISLNYIICVNSILTVNDNLAYISNHVMCGQFTLDSQKYYMMFNCFGDQIWKEVNNTPKRQLLEIVSGQKNEGMCSLLSRVFQCLPLQLKHFTLLFPALGCHIFFSLFKNTWPFLVLCPVSSVLFVASASLCSFLPFQVPGGQHKNEVPDIFMTYICSLSLDKALPKLSRFFICKMG